MDIVKDQKKDAQHSSLLQKSPGVVPSRLPSESIISLDMQNTPLSVPEKRHSTKPPYFFATTTEKTEE